MIIYIIHAIAQAEIHIIKHKREKQSYRSNLPSSVRHVAWLDLSD